jgi:DNA gyrase subunit A
MGIKLADGDACLGGALIGNRHDALTVETAGGMTKEFRRGAHPPTGRGGKGFEAVKRTTFVRVVPPPIELVDWDAVEGKTKKEEKSVERNGDGPSLFE